MAYRRRSSTGRRARSSTGRRYAKRSVRSSRGRSVRRVGAGSREIRIVVQQAPAPTLGVNPDTGNLGVPASPPRKARF